MSKEDYIFLTMILVITIVFAVVAITFMIDILWEGETLEKTGVLKFVEHDVGGFMHFDSTTLYFEDGDVIVVDRIDDTLTIGERYYIIYHETNLGNVVDLIEKI